MYKGLDGIKIVYIVLFEWTCFKIWTLGLLNDILGQIVVGNRGQTVPIYTAIANSPTFIIDQ